MKFYVSKYALTQGIEEIEGRVSETSSTILIEMGRPNGMNRYMHGKGKEWHETKDEAIARAEAMRMKKIASLQNSIKKLEKLSFS